MADNRSSTSYCTCVVSCTCLYLHRRPRLHGAGSAYIGALWLLIPSYRIVLLWFAGLKKRHIADMHFLLIPQRGVAAESPPGEPQLRPLTDRDRCSARHRLLPPMYNTHWTATAVRGMTRKDVMPPFASLPHTVKSTVQYTGVELRKKPDIYIYT